MGSAQAAERPHAARLRAVSLGLFAPPAVGWVLGTVHPALDVLSLPAAWVAGLPAAAGLPGLLVYAGLAALAAFFHARERAPRLVRSLHGASLLAGGLSALSVWCAAAAATRPLAWLPLLLAAGLPGGPRREAVPAEADPWRISDRGLHVGGALLWLAASRIRPYGDGLLGEGIEAAAARHVDWAFAAAVPLLPLLPTALLAAALARRARPKVRRAAAGAVLALALERTFGMDDAWLSAAALGALAGAWPIAPRGPQPRPVLALLAPLLAITALAGLRLGLVERWNCWAGEADPNAQFLTHEADAEQLVLLPGRQVPTLFVLRDGGGVLEKRGQAGIVLAQYRVEPKGGLLVAPSAEGVPLARAVQADGSLHVEWWDAGTVQLIRSRTVDLRCDPVAAAMEPRAQRVWIACPGAGSVLVVDPDEAVDAQRWPVGRRIAGLRLVPGPDRSLDAVVLFHRGPRSLLEVYRAADGRRLARRFVGAWAQDFELGVGYVVVSAGPGGQARVLGRPHRVPGVDPPLPAGETAAEAFARLLDEGSASARLGTWPGALRWSQAHYVAPTGSKPSMWAASPVDGRITLFDLDVTWHKKAVQVGGPTRDMEADGLSGTLFGINRCGLFELRGGQGAKALSTFPWDDVDDPPSVRRGEAAPASETDSTEESE